MAANRHIKKQMISMGDLVHQQEIIEIRNGIGPQ